MAFRIHHVEDPLIGTLEEKLESLKAALDIILHLDVHLNLWVLMLGPYAYLLLFLIIFCETGLVIFPFLPGDSLLFAVGALTSVESPALSLPVLMILLTLAAVIGDAVNYFIGSIIGPKIFKSETSRWLNKNHLIKTQAFYEKHGGKTIVLARFIPIIRTFAPFVAGIGKMKYSHFFIYNLGGAIFWVCSILTAGHYFGNLPLIKRNFHAVIVAIILISVLPIVIEWLRSRNSLSTKIRSA